MEDFIYFQRYIKGSILYLGSLIYLVQDITRKLYQLFLNIITNRQHLKLNCIFRTPMTLHVNQMPFLLCQNILFCVQKMLWISILISLMKVGLQQCGKYQMHEKIKRRAFLKIKSLNITPLSSNTITGTEMSGNYSIIFIGDLEE